MHEVSAALRGDPGAISHLVRRHAAAVRAVALAITADPVAADDIAQDSFIQAFRQLSTLRDPSTFGPWLLQITRNRAKDHLRARQREGARLGGLEPDQVVDPAASSDGGAQQQSDAAFLEEILADLPDSAREVLVLYYLEETPIAEVAERLGIDPATARQRLHRARERLKADAEARLSATARRALPAASAFVSMVLLGVAPPARAATTPSTARGVAAGIVVGLVLAFSSTAALCRAAGPEEESPVTSAAAPVVPVRPTAAPPVAVPAADAPEDARQEAWAALAAAAGGVAVTCPWPADLPRSRMAQNGMRLRYVSFRDDRLWAVADSANGSDLLQADLEMESVEIAPGKVALTARPTDVVPVLARWDAAGCTLTRAKPIRFTARPDAPGFEVLANYGTTPPGPDGAVEVTAFEGVVTLLSTRAVDGDAPGGSVELASVREGSQVVVPTTGNAPARTVPPEELQQWLEENDDVDEDLERALASPALSPAAREELEALVEVSESGKDELHSTLAPILDQLLQIAPPGDGEPGDAEE